MKNKTTNLLIALFIILVMLVGPIIFVIPNGKYLGILNFDNYFILSAVAVIVLTILINVLFKKTSRFIKFICVAIGSIIIFTATGSYYYTHLPKYTYEQAVDLVLAQEKAKSNDVKVIELKFKSDKIGVLNQSFFKTTNYYYNVNLEIDQNTVSFKVNPLNGEIEERNQAK